MRESDEYTYAHLVVSAIRVLEHRNSAPPSVDDVCGMLSFSMEQGFRLCRKLNDLGVIELVEGAFGTRLAVRDFLKIEDMPKDREDGLQKALEKYKNTRNAYSDKVAAIKAAQEKKRKDLFEKVQKNLQKELAGKVKGKVS